MTLLSSTVLVGCHVDLSGLFGLTDPTATYLNLPGQRIATGAFYQVATDGTNNAGAYFVAFENYSGGRRLAVFPFDGGAGCRTGPTNLSRFGPFFFSQTSELPFFIPYTNAETVGPFGVVDADNPQTGEPTIRTNVLHLASGACEEPLTPVVAGLPLPPAALDKPPGFLTLTHTLPACSNPPCTADSRSNLVFLQPWTNQTTTVGPGASAVTVADNKIWSIETQTTPGTNGAPAVITTKLVVRDSSFKRLAEFGTHVTEVAVTTGVQPRAAFIDQTDPATDIGKTGHLFVVTDKFETPTQIDSDACGIAFPGGYRGLGMTYYSPCETHQVVAYGSHLVSDGGPGKYDKRYVLGALPLGPIGISIMGDTIYGYFVGTPSETSSAPSPYSYDNLRLPTSQTVAEGTLRAGAIGSTFETIGNSPQTNHSVPVIGQVGNEWQALVDYRHDTAYPNSQGALAGTLVRWTTGGPTRQIAVGVEEIDASSSIAIVDFDGRTGDLVTLDQQSASAPLFHKVPAGGISSELIGSGSAIEGNGPIGIAVLADYDGTTGTLYASGPPPLAFHQVATNVSNNAYGFDLINNLNGVGFLHDYDPTTNTGVLGAEVIATGDTFDTGIRATEWDEVGWPQPGLIYVTSPGKDQAIWFAALK